MRASDLDICQVNEEAPAEQVCLSGDVKKPSTCDHRVVLAFEPTLTQQILTALSGTSRYALLLCLAFPRHAAGR